MSDAQIRKGLEYCNAPVAKCDECPYFKKSASCLVELLRDALELVQGQEREIARLRKRLEGER